MKTISNDKDAKQNLISFAFPAPEARLVSLLGDFNNWDPTAMPMDKGIDGVWCLKVALTPGRYEYRFIVDEVWQDDPAARQKIGNAMGGENCVITVSAPISVGQAQRQSSTALRGITL